MRNKAVTIKDIARMAEVSTATVSRVINGYKWVKPEVREHVLAVMEKAQYTPNYNASVMVKGKSKMIVIIVATIQNPFFSEFVSVAIRELKRGGYFAMVFETDNMAEEEIAFLSGPIARLVDGIISVTDCIDNDALIECIRPIQRMHKPIIFVDRDLPAGTADSVINDNINGIGNAVQKLICAGHSRIGMIVGHQGVSVVQDKITGYKIALDRAGVPFRPEYIRRGTWSIETGMTETNALLDMEEPPTGIIAANNYICDGVLDALEARGLEPGKDISLVGTEESENDIRMFTKLRISTLKLDSTALARFASRQILERLEAVEEETGAYQKTMFSMKLIDRGSICPPKTGAR